MKKFLVALFGALLVIAFHRVTAMVLRKFWATCPVCHRKFGGHQKHAHLVKINGVNYRYACGKCLVQK
jgi:hypothetical protein